jgi:hypothetical protein
MQPFKRSLPSPLFLSLVITLFSGIAFWVMLSIWILKAKATNASEISFSFNELNEMNLELLVFPALAIFVSISTVILLSQLFQNKLVYQVKA